LGIVHLAKTQSATIDSIKSVLDTVQVPRLHVNALHDISSQYTFRDADTAEYYVDKALALAKEISYDKGLAISYRQKGVVGLVTGNLKEALLWMDSSMIYRLKIKDIQGQVLVLNNKALIYQHLNDYDKSKEVLFEALDIAKQNNVKNREAEISNNIGLYYSKNNQLDSAIHYHELAIAINDEIGNLSEMALVESNIGAILFKEGQYQNALLRFQQAYEWAVVSKSVRTEMISSENLAVIYGTIGLYDRAIHWYNKLKGALDQTKNEKSKLSLQLNLAAVYLEKKEYEKAYQEALKAIEYRKASELQYLMAKSYQIAGAAAYELGREKEAFQLFNIGLDALSEEELQTEGMINNSLAQIHIQNHAYAKATSFLMRNLEIEKKISLPDVISPTYKYLSTIANENRDFKKAYEYRLKHESLKDSLLNLEISNAVIRSAIEFETERKEFELQLSNERAALSEAKVQTLKAERKTIVYTFGVLGLLIVVIVAWFYHMARNKRLALASETKRLSLLSENEKLKNQKLRGELELKHKEVVGLALQLAQKNEGILELRDRLNEQLKEQPNATIIRQAVQSLDGKINLEKDWIVFKASFEGVYESFFDRLKADYESLTTRELQLCALLRLNLSIKEMSNVLGISQEGAKKARYRIRKKLGLTDSADSLSSFLIKY